MGVLVFGSVNADLVFRLPALPGPGETVLGEGWRALPGGKGANQAVAAARDGAVTAFAGAVGRDAMAEVALAALRAARVDLTRLAVSGAPTGCAAICVDPEGRNQIAVASGANAGARAAQVEDAALGPATTLLLQMEVPAAEIAALALRARARGARVLLNLAPAAPLPETALRAAHLLIANEREAAWLGAALGCAAEAAPLAAALGTGVAVTRGAAGAEAATAEGALHQPAFPVATRDSTGAGDCWCGVLAAALDRGLPLAAAMRRAAAAAAIACTRDGAAACPEAAETDAFLAAR
ncbi:PfkB family carbohydrate kinase [Crenalkalicoccus roseus]|uniref:PfkB family carbohydrate kinase n=1 Tax=Crenalkalicoccus roseus TaxID=1485588 RepID=UPI0010817939|nr:PfkB family carbohydrate kinase [Crenalkalicoccus roseus]